MPVEAFESGAGEYFTIGENSPMCLYRCTTGYAPFDQNHKCVSNITLFFNNMGGISIFIIIVIATIFSISAVIYFLMTKNKNSIGNDDDLIKLKL
jgi:hypothetical protein